MIGVLNTPNLTSVQIVDGETVPIGSASKNYKYLDQLWLFVGDQCELLR